MRRKILALICAISLSITCIANFTVFAEEADLSAEKAILQGLGVLPEGRLTKNSFIYSLARFLYEAPSVLGNAEDIAKSLGVAEGEYNGNLSVTLDEAIKYSVIIAGYKSQVSDESDYKRIASELKITKGITSEGSRALREDDAIMLLYNLMDVEPMVMFYNGNEYGYKIAEGETLLSINRDIVKVYGLMTVNSYTSVYEEEGTGDESVVIDNITYFTTNDEQNNYLGRNVVAYVQGEENEDKKVIFVGERKNKNEVLVINDDDIESVESDFSKIEYIDENGRAEYAMLDEVPRVIFNGIYYGQYTVDDLAPDIGYIELIDNDNDGKYEIVNVTSYQTMLVSVTDSEDLTIRNKLSYDGCIDVLELGNDNVDYLIYNQSGEVSFSSIMTGDVLSVAQSKSKGDRKVKIYISGNEPFNGIVTSLIYDENTVWINDEDYCISDEFKKVITAESIPFKVRDSFTFYIDYFGTVAYVDYLKNSDYKVVRKISMDESTDEVFAEFMDLNEIWQKSRFASKVTVDGEKYSDYAAYNELKDYEPQVMILKFNNAGEIKEIDTADETMLNKNGNFTKTPENSYVYRLEPKSFGMQLFLENSAKLIVIPKDNINDREKYYVTNAVGSFSSNRTYTVTAYDIDEYGFTNLLMLKTDMEYEKTRIKNIMFVVTNVYDEVFDGEVRPVIMGYMGEYKNMTVIADKEGVYDGIRPGDVINISTNMKGEATYVRKLISLENFSPINANSMYESRLIVAGTIENIDAQKGKLKVNIGKSAVVRLNGQMSVCVYDPKTRQCEIKTTYDLAEGDKVVLKVEYGNVAEISAVK